MRRPPSWTLLLAGIAFALSIGPAAGAAPARKDPRDQSELAGLQWRNLGPYRGGRVTAVAGRAVL